MLTPAQDACLLIADISGYTGYLTSTELEHAQDVIRDFIDNVISALEPTFELVETEGDAVFVVAALDGLNGQLVLDVVDACYFTFRRHSRSVVLSTTCECNACRQIGSLDLKFVVHSGPIVRARMGRRMTVTGEAAIVAHRLLKNSVRERFGPNAYLLLSERAMADLRLDEAALQCSRSIESYEHIGEIPTLVIDMEARWRAAEGASTVQVTRDAAAVVVERHLPAPPAVVWDYLNDPRKRLLYQTDIIDIDEQTTTGRREVGTLSHCAHGNFTSNHEMLEWRPFERFTMDNSIPGLGSVRTTVNVFPDGDGTRVEDLTSAMREDPNGVWPRARVFIETGTNETYDRLEQLLRDR